MKVFDGVHRIDGVRGNAYVLTGESMMLVDTGMPGSGPKIVSYIRGEMNADEHDVSVILLTHQHIDHVGSAIWLKNATGARIAMHEQDVGYVTGERKPLKPRGAIGAAFTLLSPFLKVRRFVPDMSLADGDRVGPLRILHLPGHTPGSMALLDDARRVAFSGDIVSRRKGRVAFPPGAFNHDDSSMRKSLGRLLAESLDVLLPGHGEPVAKSDRQELASLADRLTEEDKLQ